MPARPPARRARASRIETKDGKYRFYPQGSSVAVEEDPANVRCIGCDACSPVKNDSSQASGRFGIGGSNTIGEALLPAIISAYSKSTYGSPSISVPQAEPDTQVIKLGGADAPAVTIDFSAKGSGTAPKLLKEKKVQIGMMSRRMKPEEMNDIKTNLNMDTQEHVLALDGVAVIVHPDNPIKKLDLPQIAKIFAGEITNWRDVHGKNEKNIDVTGPDLPIKVHARDNKSGTFDTFKAVVLEAAGKKISPQAVRYESSDELSSAVSNPKDTSGIGFIGFAYINKGKPVGILSQCGIDSQPEPYLVKLEAYPLARRLYLYTLGEPAEPAAGKILRYALSDDAQKIVVDNGFIDQTVGFQEGDKQNAWLDGLISNPEIGMPEGKPINSAAARELASRVRGFKRTSIVFRFESGQATLDTLARQNLTRFADYAQRAGLDGRRVLLVGFADTDGSWETNYSLSFARTRTVAGMLGSLGVRIPNSQLVPMSYAAPFACNDVEEKGRALNRRVEVWIAK